MWYHPSSLNFNPRPRIITGGQSRKTSIKTYGNLILLFHSTVSCVGRYHFFPLQHSSFSFPALWLPKSIYVILINCIELHTVEGIGLIRVGKNQSFMEGAKLRGMEGEESYPAGYHAPHVLYLLSLALISDLHGLCSCSIACSNPTCSHYFCSISILPPSLSLFQTPAGFGLIEQWSDAWSQHLLDRLRQRLDQWCSFPIIDMEC